MPRAVPSGTIQAMGKPIVCIAGAGTAGLEGLLAKRVALGASCRAPRTDRPDREFRYRPMSRRFAVPSRARAGDLDRRAGRRRWCEVAQGPRRGRARLSARAHPGRRPGGFDFLLLAPGERSTRPLRQGYVWGGEETQFLIRSSSSWWRALSRASRSSVPAAPAGRYPRMSSRSSSGGRPPAPCKYRADHGQTGGLPPRIACLGRRVAELELAGVEMFTGVELIDEPEAVPRPR